jgi:hypothetical protein
LAFRFINPRAALGDLRKLAKCGSVAVGSRHAGEPSAEEAANVAGRLLKRLL